MKIYSNTYGQKPYSVNRDVTKDSVLEQAHLNWRVEKRPIYFTDNDGNKTPVLNNFANVRTDTNVSLGIVGKSYNVFQNEDLLEVALPFFDIEDIHFETAGYFGNGESVFMLFKLPNFIRVNGDETEQMLFIGNSHDGSSCINISLTPIRVFCGNTFKLAMKNSQIRIKHFSNSMDRVRQAHEILGITNHLTNQLNDIFNNMAKQKVTDKYIDDIVYELHNEKPNTPMTDISTRKSNSIYLMKKYINNEFENSPALNGNKYGLFNGITAYYNHGIYNSPSGATKRFEKIINGSASKNMERAFKILSE